MVEVNLSYEKGGHMKRLMKKLSNMTLESKIYLLSLGIVLVFLIMLFFQYNYTNSLIKENAKEKMDLVTRNINADISAWLSKNGLIIKNIATFIKSTADEAAVIQVSGLNDSRILEIMKTFLHENPFFTSIYYGDENNKMINASGWDPYEGFDLRTRSWYKNALKEDDLVYTNLFLNASKDDIIISIAYPVQFDGKNAVISGDVSVKTLISEIAGKQPSESGFVFLMDEESNILAHPRYTDWDILNIHYKDERYSDLLEKAKKNQTEFFDFELEGEKGFVVFKHVEGLNWYLLSFIPYSDLNAATENLPGNFAIILILITFIIFIFFRIQKKNIVEPINTLKEKIIGLDFKENFQQRIDYPIRNEFSSLVDTINGMLSEARNTFLEKESAEEELKAMNEELLSGNIELENEKELLNGLVENLPVGIMVLDSDLNIIITNYEFTQLTGYDTEDIKSINEWFELACTDPHYSRTVWYNSIYLKEESSVIQSRIVTKEGETRVVEFRSNRLKNGNVIISLTDITRKREDENKILESEKKAKKANRAKSDFLANMSHELRTPLNGVIGFAEIIKDTELTDEQREYLDNVITSGRNLLQIISDILDFSKIEAGRMELDEVKTNIIKLIKDSMKIIEPKADKKGLTLKTEIDRRLPTFVLTDPLRLKQVFLNLLSNAVKFTEQGEIKFKATLKESKDGMAFITFDVLDTGIGIAEEMRLKIMDSFTQADSSITRKYGGTGLGLTISNSILTQMGSGIQLESTVDEGSRFTFSVGFRIANKSLPPVEKTENLSLSPDNSKNAKKTDTKMIKILLAEDDRLNLKLAKTVISKNLSNAVVYTADDGQEALEVFRQKSPDVVILDIHMPRYNGLEVTRKIRGDALNDKRTPVIGLTADVTGKMLEKAKEAGMDDIITKPLKKHELLEKILTHSAL